MLYDRAFSVAQDAFDVDGNIVNVDKVCAVAVHVARDEAVSFFSGKPGYDKLVERIGGDAKKTQADVTQFLTDFLKSNDGGSFTDQQIRQKGFADHGRGAMNCAEPKVYYYLRKVKNENPRDWVMIPFNMGQNGLIYNPPCKNCRRWVHKTFHMWSGLTAAARGGAAALQL